MMLAAAVETTNHFISVLYLQDFGVQTGCPHVFNIKMFRGMLILVTIM